MQHKTALDLPGGEGEALYAGEVGE
jgi:hypothetical protein